MEDCYQVYAVQYGHHDRTASANFVGGDPHDRPMPLDYFVWAIVGDHGTYVLDTGFDAAMGLKRNRQLVRPVNEGLRTIGIDAATVSDVIISHMHFDHAGNHAMFPQARYHVQDAEMAYCTGRCMCHEPLRHAYEPGDVQAMIGRLFDGRLQFHDGDSELAPGLTLHRVGGHTRGLQVVRVKTRRGWVVLGSDAAHLYANFEQARPFPSFDSMTDMLFGFDRMRELASSESHIIPGHDPLVLSRYPLARGDVAGVVRLDVEPVGS
ncbi:N-acyl homoserine lactonase family protein [Sphingobium chlorophenolicum]|uniref:Putative Zn-dependent hydrolase n=1 Tax=Sphingobium chlorophenolicum TaxID=46429 RepID=A0A081RF45_SPHCR|nr:N-acyl homoserine lactonase family protein [Sphingobium chlorophenolicum]KEQ53818.1 putative Zn-dependent hydrolase [Sphingobium chlorophenolicum]